MRRHFIIAAALLLLIAGAMIVLLPRLQMRPAAGLVLSVTDSSIELAEAPNGKRSTFLFAQDVQIQLRQEDGTYEQVEKGAVEPRFFATISESRWTWGGREAITISLLPPPKDAQ